MPILRTNTTTLATLATLGTLSALAIASASNAGCSVNAVPYASLSSIFDDAGIKAQTDASSSSTPDGSSTPDNPAAPDASVAPDGATPGTTADPAILGTWSTPNPLGATRDDYVAFTMTLVYAASGTVTVSTSGIRAATAATAPGCTEQMTAPGTFTTQNGSSVSTKIAAGTLTRSACTDSALNASSPLPDAAIGLLADAASGSYLVTPNTFSLTTASSGTLAYQRP